MAYIVHLYNVSHPVHLFIFLLKVILEVNYLQRELTNTNQPEYIGGTLVPLERLRRLFQPIERLKGSALDDQPIRRSDHKRELVRQHKKVCLQSPEVPVRCVSNMLRFEPEPAHFKFIVQSKKSYKKGLFFKSSMGRWRCRNIAFSLPQLTKRALMKSLTAVKRRQQQYQSILEIAFELNGPLLKGLLRLLQGLTQETEHTPVKLRESVTRVKRINIFFGILNA